MAKIIMPDDQEEQAVGPIKSGLTAAQASSGALNKDRTRVTMVNPNGEEVELPQSRISAGGPAAIVEGGKPEEVEIAETFEEGQRPANMIEAAAQGTQTGVKLAVAVGAMVMVFVALVALANGLLYFDMVRTGRSTANMIQGLRDFFGAHGFERIDAEGAHHGPWGSGRG